MRSNFNCPLTQALFEGKPAPRFVNCRTAAERKPEMLHRAQRLEDLRAPPNNRLEKLTNDRHVKTMGAAFREDAEFMTKPNQSSA